jgi:hypothetical protein
MNSREFPDKILYRNGNRTELLTEEVADSVTCNRYGDCVSLLREPDALDLHVRFDERGVGTEAWRE